jgi:ABC-type transport system involved in cytochrome c biogenesis permease subunit
LLYLQSTALIAGTYIGWSTIFKEINKYCEITGDGYSSLLTFSGTITKNPLLTPCFWGSIAFVIALVWSLMIVLEKDKVRARLSEKRLLWLLGGGTIFALGNNAPILYRYFFTPNEKGLSCGGTYIDNPFTTACFLGFCAFFAAFILGIVWYKLNRKVSTDEKNS